MYVTKLDVTNKRVAEIKKHQHSIVSEQSHVHTHAPFSQNNIKRQK